MSKINILDQSIFNKIAAGEVVEKPASVVKEFLDNAIDAGATNIFIDIKDGGITNITVRDNGCGIEVDDFDKVFLAHATSKIKCVDDLSKIGTLGFRGEALASIASVSKVTLISKTLQQTLGCKMIVNFGEQNEILEVGAENGTTIMVENLFLNVPARAKFLRKPKTEMSDISNLIERYILVNPKINFCYRADDKVVLQSSGTNLFEEIYVIYGKNATDEIVKVDSYNQSSGITVSGYIGTPTFSKPNRTYQTISINNRYINSSLISMCVYNSYEHFLMKGQFPFFVLNLNIPIDKLDVNVHPNKMEVRFNNSNEIYGVVYNAISSALFQCDKISTVSTMQSYKKVNSGASFSDDNSLPKARIVEILPFKQNNEKSMATNENIASENVFLASDNSKEIKQNVLQSNTATSMFIDSILSPKQDCLCQPSSPIMSSLIQSKMEQMRLSQKNDALETGVEIIDQNEARQNNTEQFLSESEIKFVGTIFATYLMIEKQSKVYIIDQHAAHERLLFDRLIEQVNKNQVVKQNLLTPFSLNLNFNECEFLEQNLDNLKKIGFEIEPFGKLSFVVTSIPYVLTDLSIDKFFNDMLSNLTVFKSTKQSDLVLNKLMQHSCKCAIRAGKLLSLGEVSSLIEQIKNEKMQLQCPHGRPVIVEIERVEIEKWFKRIV